MSPAKTPNVEALEVYRSFPSDIVPARGLLIPGKRYDAHSISPAGKRYEDGKRPLHNGWTTKSYGIGKVIDHARQGFNACARPSDAWFVLDYDPRNDPDGDSLDRLERDMRFKRTDYPGVRTGGGGLHLYMRAPKGNKLRIRKGIEGYPGVDLKGIGGQVIAAGSIHPSGNYYEWAKGHAPLAKMPEAPNALWNLAKAPELPAFTRSRSGGGDGTPDVLQDYLRCLDPLWWGAGGKYAGYHTKPYGFFYFIAACHYFVRGEPEGFEVFADWAAQDPEYADAREQLRMQWEALHTEKPGRDVVTEHALLKVMVENGHSYVLQAPKKGGGDFAGMPIEDEFKSEFEPDKSGALTVGRNGLRVNSASRADDTYSNAFIAIVQSGLDPAFDELSQTAIFRNPPWDASNGNALNDHTLRLVRLQLTAQFQGNAYEPSEKHVFDALMAVAYANKFNPVLDYIDGLRWDGVQRLDRLFVDYFPCGDDAYTRAVSASFMIGAVRRMRKPGCKLDTMPVIKGVQGAGKSSGFQALIGRDYFSDAELGSLTAKDAALNLRGKWVHEFAELNALSKHAVGELKAFLSRANDRQRDPYARVAQDYQRRCVFVGTVNEGGYLRDPTGARRFLPLELAGRVDLDAIKADRDQLWAEAAAREAAGELHVLPESLWPVASERQRAQTSSDPWADTLLTFLNAREARYFTFESDTDGFGSDDLPPDRVHTSELFAALDMPKQAQTPAHSQRLRTIMESALGWSYAGNIMIDGAQGRGYVRGA